MLLESAVEIEAAPAWAPENKYEAQTDWQSVDRALRTILSPSTQLSPASVAQHFVVSASPRTFFATPQP